MRILVSAFLLVLSFPIFADFWSLSNRDMSRTPMGNKVAVSCHNCYSNNDSSQSLTNTLNFIREGQNAGADLIEIDLVMNQSLGTWVVSHGSTTGPDYQGVFSHSYLRNGNQIPFIEIKSKLNSSIYQNYADELVNTLLNNGYMASGKMVVIRSFHTDTLNRVKQALTSISPTAANRVKLSRLYGKNAYSSLSSWQSNIRSMSLNYHMVEFEYQTKNIASLIEYAKSLNLGINLWTIRNFTEVFSAAFRDNVDALTVDSNRGGGNSRSRNIRLAKSVVSDDNNILYFNMAKQRTSYYGTSYLRYFDRAYRRSKASSSAGHPDWEWLNAVGEDRFGGSLIFRSSQNNYLQFHDVDNDSREGFFVHTVVNFDDLSTTSTQAIINKSDSGGFALELNGAYLRFGVHVNGQYHYAKYPKSALNTTDSFQIIGAYDGNGGVWIWVDGKAGPTRPSTSGGVTQNNSPIVVGADPQGWSSQRFFFAGKVQLVNVQRWGNH